MAQKNPTGDTKTADKAIRLLLEGKVKTLGEALVKAGYSAKGYGKTPSELYKKEHWQKLVEKYLKDGVVVKKHKELLNARTVQKMKFEPDTPDEDIQKSLKLAGCTVVSIRTRVWKYTTSKGQNKEKPEKIVLFVAPDYNTQDKALEKSYKLKGAYAPERFEVKDDRFGDLSDEDLQSRLEDIEFIVSRAGKYAKHVPKEKQNDNVEEKENDKTQKE